MLKKILTALFALIAIVVVVGVFLPKDYVISRATVIDAKPEKIHTYVGDLKKWDAWEPWREGDPTLVITLGDKTTGVGASQSWDGKSGDGRLVFTETSPQTGVKYDLFFRQDQEKCKSTILYTPMESKTNVTWTMEGSMDVPVLGGWMVLMLEGMVAPMFENGLAKLKRAVEAA